MREHGGADIFRSLGAAAFQQLQTLQFMFLLLQLLDHSVIQCAAENSQARGPCSAKDAFFADAAAHTAHHQQTHNKGKTRGHEHQCHAQHNGIGRQSHSNPQYQCRKLLP